jgi:hypothetical protein
LEPLMGSPQIIPVSNELELNQAIVTVDQAGSGSYVIQFTRDIFEDDTGQSIFIRHFNFGGGITFPAPAGLLAINLHTGVALTIDGQDNAFLGNSGGLFAYSGVVTVQDLSISTVARGGDGASSSHYAGGGGAGLGGGLFVGSGAQVTLSGVIFAYNYAVGGNGGSRNRLSGEHEGGGGGLGGDGGYGGGGVGAAASGYKGPGGEGRGIIYRARQFHSGSDYYGGGGSENYGGGVGSRRSYVPSFYAGGDGGFGGGGGAGVDLGGNGGFGGGGGGGRIGGYGGFGGGGGAGYGYNYGKGGFGGGSGGLTYSGATRGGGGGGGLGAGGSIFVQQGGTLVLAGFSHIYGGRVQGGLSGGGLDAQQGGAYGSGIFIQGNQTITFAPGLGQTQSISDDIADQSGSGGTGADAGIGAILVLGPGTVELGGDNTFTGGVTVIGGGAVLSVAADDNLGAASSTLTLDNGTTLDLNGSFTLTQSIVLAGDPTFDVAAGNTVTINTAIADGAAPGDVVETGGGTLVLATTNTYSGGTTINAGTLELGNSGAAGSGTITFGTNANATLQIDGTTMPSNTIAGFSFGDFIDLAGVDGTSATLNSNNDVLTIDESGGGSVTLQLQGNYAGDSFVVEPDGNGSVVRMSTPATLGVSNEQELNQAIADVDSATSGDYTIEFTQSILEGTDTGDQIFSPGGILSAPPELYAINLHSGVALTIDGGGNTLYANSGYRGFFAYAGSVTIQNLALNGQVARGGYGGDAAGLAGGGGAGLGGGLFIGAGANVTLSNVSFLNNGASGGNGGRVGSYALAQSGGGGLGGNGGYAGGGIGSGATGGILGAGSYGIVLNEPNGGGGGYGNYRSAASGGGGGIGGQTSSGQIGGAGGFGGGGGTGINGGGNGGFGGGGGGYKGDGGFGGGGGGYNGLHGFGGGDGGPGNGAGGGGGLGAGGDIFIQEGGSLTIEGGGSAYNGTVHGGIGYNGGQTGSYFGGGIFLQGKETVTFAPGPGQTLTFADVIADESGSGGSGVGSLIMNGAGTLVLSADNTYTGTTDVQSGTLLIDGANTNSAVTVGNGGTIGGTGTAGAVTVESGGTFAPGDPSTLTVTSLTLNSGATFAEQIGGTTAGTGGTGGYDQTVVESGTIELNTAMLDVSVVNSFMPSVGNTFTIINNETGNQVNGTFAGLVQGTTFETDDAWFQINYDAGANNDVTLTDVACYCRGTLIRIDHSEVPVEQLAIGNHVVTLSSEMKPIKWIGRRLLDCRRHPDPTSVWPIRVSAGAFGENKPSRDLWLSPGHNIAAEGVLMPIKALQNGKTIVQHQRSTVEYWHIELDQHDIIFAEGLPAESYLDTGNRTGFVNGGVFIEAHPDFKPKHWAATCLPLVQEGPEIARTKAVLLERLKALGYVTTSEADLYVIADGKRIEPIELGAMRFAFTLPPACRDIRLMSRTFIPAHTRAASTDTRSLGLCVKRLQINGEDVPLDDQTILGRGWNALERHPDVRDQRWTRGDTPIPANARLIVIDLAGPGHYWQEPKDNVVALFG